jgi:predicted nuclease of restriction endonuclease-like (RecB) superfamily
LERESGKIKSFEEFLKPDSRIVANPNEIEKSIKNLYEHALESTLVEQVPENVRSLWDVAQHLFVYSCYSYDFLPVAKTYCLFSLEQALKKIIRKKLRFLV